MKVTILQAILLGIACGSAKSIIFYTLGAIQIQSVLFNAFLCGLIMGDMKTAIIVGVAIQLIYLGVVTAGGNQATDPCLATFVAVPIAIATKIDTSSAVALAVPLGLLGAQLQGITYLIAGFFAQRGDVFAKKGEAKGIVRWSLILCYIMKVVIWAIPVAVTVYFGSSVLQGVLDNIPGFVTNGLSAMGNCLPAVGFAIISSLISKPKYMPFFFAGFFIVQYTKIGTVPLVLIGAFLMFLYLTFTSDSSAAVNKAGSSAGSDTTADKILSKKDILKTWLIWWTTAEISHSYERMQAPSFCAALAPALKKFYPNKEDHDKYAEALQRNMTFFNTQGEWGAAPIIGMTLALEEQKSKDYNSIPDEMIINLKTSLMGPLAGIGDTLSWSTIMYLLIGLFLPLASKGNWIGAFAPTFIQVVFALVIGYVMMQKAYTVGFSFATNMLKSGIFSKVIAGASVLGLFMMGGLAATYVTVSTPLKFATASYSITLQSILDSILPGILPLAVVLLVWLYLSKVKRNYFVATLGVTVISLALGCIGILI